MREWHKPTIDETESGWKLRATAGRMGSRLIRTSHLGNRKAAIRRNAWSSLHLFRAAIAIAAASALRPTALLGSKSPVQISLMWYQCSVHERIMHRSLGIPTFGMSK